MKLIDKRQFGTILDYLSDGIFIYVLVHTKEGTDILSVNPDKLSDVKSFSVSRFLHPISNSCVDHSSLYVPLDTGDIAALDKFSGRVYANISTSSFVVFSDIFQDNDNIYCLNGIPILNRYVVKTDEFCICSYDKKTGKKMRQSQSVKGATGHLSVKNGEFFLSIDKKLHKFDKNMKLIKSNLLAVSSKFNPIITDNFIVIASERGTLEVIDKGSMELRKRWLVEKNDFGPVYNEDFIYWVGNKQIRRIDLIKLSVETIAVLDSELKSDICIYSGNIHGMDSEGQLFKFNIQDKKLEYVYVSNEKFWRPMAIKNNVILFAENNMVYTVEK